jgi:hypothetical protein
MYNLRNVFAREPNAIREAILAILGIFVMLGVIDVSAEVVAAVGVAISLVLGLFYVRPLTASKDALNELGEAESTRAAAAKASNRKSRR